MFANMGRPKGQEAVRVTTAIFQYRQEGSLRTFLAMLYIR